MKRISLTENTEYHRNSLSDFLLCNSVTSVSKNKKALTEHTEYHRNGSSDFLLCNSVTSVRNKNIYLWN